MSQETKLRCSIQIEVVKQDFHICWYTYLDNKIRRTKIARRKKKVKFALEMCRLHSILHDITYRFFLSHVLQEIHLHQIHLHKSSWFYILALICLSFSSRSPLFLLTSLLASLRRHFYRANFIDAMPLCIYFLHIAMS